MTYLRTGRTEETWLMRGIYYEFPDGSTIDVDTHIAWCGNCCAFTDGELIESPDYIREQIADLRNPESDAYKFAVWNEQQIQLATGKSDPHSCELMIAALDLRLKWRLKRISPAKCIQCGSTDLVFPLSMHDTESEIEISDVGPVRVESAGISSTEFMNWFFTSEGDRIARNTTPTYWGVSDTDT
jgi:hypothetical protein